MNRYALSAISLLATSMAASLVLADNMANAVHSQRLFFTPLERAQLTAGPPGASADDDNISSEEDTVAAQRHDSELKVSAGRQSQSGERQVDHKERIFFNALVFASDGVYILLNGVPCYRFHQRSRDMPVQNVVRLSCPHIDNGRYQIDYVASAEKIDVYGNGKRLGLLAVGESL